MFPALKRYADEFLALEPGTRFITSFTRHQQARGSPGRRVAFIGLGMVLVVAGLVALVAPGPGMVMVAGGLLLIARESRLLARALDRLELALRGAWARSPVARRVSTWWSARRDRRRAARARG